MIYKVESKKDFKRKIVNELMRIGIPINFYENEHSGTTVLTGDLMLSINGKGTITVFTVEYPPSPLGREFHENELLEAAIEHFKPIYKCMRKRGLKFDSTRTP